MAKSSVEYDSTSYFSSSWNCRYRTRVLPYRTYDTLSIIVSMYCIYLASRLRASSPSRGTFPTPLESLRRVATTTPAIFLHLFHNFSSTFPSPTSFPLRHHECSYPHRYECPSKVSRHLEGNARLRERGRRIEERFLDVRMVGGAQGHDPGDAA